MSKCLIVELEDNITDGDYAELVEWTVVSAGVKALYRPGQDWSPGRLITIITDDDGQIVAEAAVDQSGAIIRVT